MNTLIARLRRFIKNEDGPTAVEYAVMVALIAVAIIVTVRALGTNLSTTFSNVSSALPSGTTS
ncbi:Flp family type IVb pilin [Tautonia sociabilis]|uniref:Flp family type IVb pilin n=1 Tax=Tautonia sociabilis TaxID=2080755 RepID=A0A432MHW7_9BACT|nr:Flp family type IVb pilin [Tautonia sociabilis]RUL86725.1 Flp family type IVb pilin [Tautonia sociabilis]